jgi:hypothetical protein
MKTYVKVFNGHEVPEGATHQASDTSFVLFAKWIGNHPVFFNVNNECWVEDKLIGRHYFKELPEAELEPVEADWINTLSGLPPIGTACLISAKSTLPEWHNGVVDFYGDKLCVYTLNNEECVKDIDFLIFRPLKSAEEIARDSFILAAYKIGNSLESFELDHIFAAMHKEGFTAPKDKK